VAVYLIHLDPPYRHAKHYLGFTDTSRNSPEEAVATRLEYHKAGRGSRLLRVAVQAGCVLRVVRIWDEGTRTDERRLKSHASGRYCPICNDRWATRGMLSPSR
jgi:hypothetical protein